MMASVPAQALEAKIGPRSASFAHRFGVPESGYIWRRRSHDSRADTSSPATGVRARLKTFQGGSARRRSLTAPRPGHDHEQRPGNDRQNSPAPGSSTISSGTIRPSRRDHGSRPQGRGSDHRQYTILSALEPSSLHLGTSSPAARSMTARLMGAYLQRPRGQGSGRAQLSERQPPRHHRPPLRRRASRSGAHRALPDRQAERAYLSTTISGGARDDFVRHLIMLYSTTADRSGSHHAAHASPKRRTPDAPFRREHRAFAYPGLRSIALLQIRSDGTPISGLLLGRARSASAP